MLHAAASPQGVYVQICVLAYLVSLYVHGYVSIYLSIFLSTKPMLLNNINDVLVTIAIKPTT